MANIRLPNGSDCAACVLYPETESHSWILTKVERSLKGNRYLVKDEYATDSDYETYTVDSNHITPFPSSPNEEYKVGENVLALWKDEDSNEWSTMFYHAKVISNTSKDPMIVTLLYSGTEYGLEVDKKKIARYPPNFNFAEMEDFEPIDDSNIAVEQSNENEQNNANETHKEETADQITDEKRTSKVGKTAKNSKHQKNTKNQKTSQKSAQATNPTSMASTGDSSTVLSEDDESKTKNSQKTRSSAVSDNEASSSMMTTRSSDTKNRSDDHEENEEDHEENENESDPQNSQAHSRSRSDQENIEKVDETEDMEDDRSKDETQDELESNQSEEPTSNSVQNSMPAQNSHHHHSNNHYSSRHSSHHARAVTIKEETPKKSYENRKVFFSFNKPEVTERPKLEYLSNDDFTALAGPIQEPIRMCTQEGTPLLDSLQDPDLFCQEDFVHVTRSGVIAVNSGERAKNTSANANNNSNNNTNANNSVSASVNQANGGNAGSTDCVSKIVSGGVSCGRLSRIFGEWMV
ncbi:hypothetical protein TRFO_11357 [Tritrichomonas foetus]|uniref:SGF29 C-terminal domain-containing protein n=1 Tax=Tritrichomonas foetus TaxID=1144522 RepID=A0A1J4J7C8_9EUKA|nr:hypothetical protein TRFO_11357 [Tritrichomonas foetus]|eukprot:OHS94095.1 hypothetical protein TRFO_11357 [Tritrichomonas foetus]